MRIALIIDQLKSNAISGSHFEQAILREIDSLEISEYKFYVFTNSDLNEIKPVYTKNIRYVSTRQYQNRVNKYPRSLLSRFVLRCVANSLSRKLFKAKLVESLKNKISESPLNKALKENKIDLAWNVFSSEMIDLPYIATCLDCYDLINPYLPENNIPGYWLGWNNKSFHYYRRASYILASTNVLKEQLKLFYGLHEDKIRINPFFTPEFDGIDTTFESIDISGVNLESEFLFYPSRYIAQKNHIVIIEALKLLKDSKDIRPQVVFCGRDVGNLEYLKFKVSEYGLEEQFVFLGLVDFPSLAALYKKAKALIYTSFVGPDNLPPLEAFSYQCPVIASNVSGAIEQLGSAALLFEPTDEKKLVEHIQSVYKNPQLVQELILKGKKVSDAFTVFSYVQNVMKIFEEFSKLRRAWADDNFINSASAKI